ncbi:MAG: histidine triad nucleotide-binding protein [Desulfuromonas sp.]|nr:MAG: histidine triad nucleotide-binding protein [Desulfuromonas sp.]
MSSDCLFCKIIAGDIPAKMCYEDEHLVAFADIDPQAPQHLLIVPRKHIATAMDLTDEDCELVGRVYRVAAKLARDLGFADNGFRLVNNCNADGGQVIWHIHFHLLAGRQMTWPPG